VSVKTFSNQLFGPQNFSHRNCYF